MRYNLSTLPTRNLHYLLYLYLYPLTLPYPARVYKTMFLIRSTSWPHPGIPSPGSWRVPSVRPGWNVHDTHAWRSVYTTTAHTSWIGAEKNKQMSQSTSTLTPRRHIKGVNDRGHARPLVSDRGWIASPRLTRHPHRRPPAAFGPPDALDV